MLNKWTRIISYNLIGLDKSGTTLFFYYDSNGTPTSFSNNVVMYYYVKNLRGDIVKITKQDGTVVASYVYDVSGKLLSVKDSANDEVANSDAFHIANINPYRYRGYLYDTETGLYYLQTRYYDPIIGRFINADDDQYLMEQLLSSNMYAYCINDPISYVDYNGRMYSPNIDTIFSFFKVAKTAFSSMTCQMYLLSIYNMIEDRWYDFSGNKDYVQAVKESKLYKEAYEKLIINIDSIIEKMIHEHDNYEYVGKESIKFADDKNMDLALSIGKCDMYMYIQRKGYSISGGRRFRKYCIIVRILDRYDFGYEKMDSVVNVINDFLGLAPQMLQIITPYNWRMDIKHTYSYECIHGY